MRLDARNGDYNWQCYDVERAALVPEVVFIDTDSATWGRYDTSRLAIVGAFLTGSLPVIVHHEKRIEIVSGQRMVLFNPIEDSEPGGAADVGIALSPRSVEFAR